MATCKRVTNSQMTYADMKSGYHFTHEGSRFIKTDAGGAVDLATGSVTVFLHPHAIVDEVTYGGSVAIPPVTEYHLTLSQYEYEGLCNTLHNYRPGGMAGVHKALLNCR